MTSLKISPMTSQTVRRTGISTSIAASRNARRGMILPTVLGLGVLLTLVVGLGYCQSTATRNTARRLLSRAQARDVASSAIEEACARLELDVVPPAPNANALQRDLGATIAWPSSIDPVLTRADATAVGAAVSPVTVKVSPWKVEDLGHYQNLALVREVGIVELTVKVTVSVGSSPVERTVTVRRYASVARQALAPEVRLEVQQRNLYYGMNER